MQNNCLTYLNLKFDHIPQIIVFFFVRVFLEIFSFWGNCSKEEVHYDFLQILTNSKYSNIFVFFPWHNTQNIIFPRIFNNTHRSFKYISYMFLWFSFPEQILLRWLDTDCVDRYIMYQDHCSGHGVPQISNLIIFQTFNTKIVPNNHCIQKWN